MVTVHSRPEASSEAPRKRGQFSLASHPIAKEWHPTKNGRLKPEDVALCSNKKVWWLCGQFEGGRCDQPGCGTVHEWDSSPNSRVRGSKCLFCCNHPKKLCLCKSLAFKFPTIASEWHPTRNGDLKPLEVFSSAAAKVWWLCKGCPDCAKRHEFEATVNTRTSKQTPCPFCSGTDSTKWLCECRSLASRFPSLVEHEWLKERNQGVEPSHLSWSADVCVWWVCKTTPRCGVCDTHHVWKASIRDRTSPYHPTGCPFCAGAKALCKCRSLEWCHPDIAKEWHPTKNGDLKSEDVHKSSNQLVWWKCSKVPVCEDCQTEHSWPAPVNKRTDGRNVGCPFCSGTGNVICKCRSLALRRPEVAAHWHPTLNNGVSPHQVYNRSGVKYWWQCPDDQEHTWQAAPAHFDRLQCSKCVFKYDFNGRRYGPLPRATLADGAPDIAREWHPELNGEVTPDHVGVSSKFKAWWICATKPTCPVCETPHVWRASVNDRTRAASTNCPFCSTPPKRVCRCDSTAVRYPELQNELHPTLNPPQVDLFSIHPGSAVSLWWLCGRGHSWPARLYSRTGPNKTGCPTCNTNRYELRLKTTVEDWVTQGWVANAGIQLPLKDCPTLLDPSRCHRTLRCDGWVLLHDGTLVIVELDGPTHFAPQTYYHRSESESQKAFQEICLRDLAKDTECLRRGYRVARISVVNMDYEEGLTSALLDALEAVEGGERIWLSDATQYARAWDLCHDLGGDPLPRKLQGLRGVGQTC